MHTTWPQNFRKSRRSSRLIHATLTFYADKMGKIAVAYQGWDEKRVVLEGQVFEVRPGSGVFAHKRVAIWMFGSGREGITDPWPTPVSGGQALGSARDSSP